uniref:GUN4 domain-containing protein n=1 Tax=Oscillatoriales cyanobacterium SpSt-402 TaxID=2282168 RepID=A0A832M3K9_9CYAN
MPLIVPEPGWKYDRPLLTHCATKADIETLKSQAIHAWIIEKNLDLAEQLWELINDLATDSQDRKLSRESLLKIVQERQATGTAIPQQLQNPAREGLATSLPASPLSPAKLALTNPQDLGKGRLAGEKYGLDLDASPRETQKPIEDDLSSEKGIDYTKLRDLLEAQKWKEADQETYEVMIRAVGKKDGSWFTPEELLKFPCKDLKTINALWVKYSNEHFGFSVQKQIYVECGAKLDGKYPGDEIWEKFGDRVGWRKDGNWLSYDRLNPSFSSPKGMFPLGGLEVVRLRFFPFGGVCGGGWVDGVWVCASSLASRLAECNR